MDTILKPILLESFTDKLFFTKNNDAITFKIFNLNQEHFQEDNSFLNIVCIQAFVANECAGYISLSYLSDEIKNKYFNNVMDYFIWTHGTTQLQTLYNDCNLIAINEIIEQKLGSSEQLTHAKADQSYDNLSLSEKYAFLYNVIETKYSCAYDNFISFRHNRPNVEMVCVYNEQDKKCKNFDSFPFISENRENLTNFRQQGISQALYKVGGLLMQYWGMNIHSSNIQSHDGKKMWSILENHPCFNVMLDSYLTTNTKNRDNLISQERKKLVVLA